MVMFSKTATETITIKNLKHWICQGKKINKYDILYNVEKVLKNAIQW